MLLKLSEKKLFIVDIDTDCRDKNSYWRKAPKSNFSEYFKIKPVIEGAEFPSGHSYSTYYYGSDKYGGKLDSPMYGFYFGDAKTLNDIVDNKYTTPNWTSVKKVFFDPNCKYPRFKLSETTNIKRCLDPAKADCVIMTKSTFTNTRIHRDNSSKLLPAQHVMLMYSKQEDEYYLIPTLTTSVGDTACTSDFMNKIDKHSKLSSRSPILDKLIDSMKNAQIVAHDSQIIYTGPFFAIGSKELLVTIDGLINNYMLITYDTELDKFVSQGLQQVTNEDLKALTKMMSSTDQSVIGMAIKLLSNYNIQDAPLTIGTLIINNFSKMQYVNEINSVGFKQVLSTLNLTIDQLKSHYSTDSMINTLYSKSTNDDERTKTRTMLIDQLTDELNDSIKKRLSNLTAFGFNIELKIT